MARGAGKSSDAATATQRRSELVAHFRKARDPLRKQWVELMTTKGLLPGMSAQEIETESMAIYDTCVNCLATGTYEDAEEYAARMAGRGVLQSLTSEQILGGMLTLRDVYGRSLFERYRDDMGKLFQALDVYEPVANQILAIVALAFIQERERVVADQQSAIRELSTPVLPLRATGLLILPIIGVIDTQRARQLTEQLLNGIRSHRAKAVVLDITGVPIVDSKVANHLVQTVEASRLMGATVIISGLSPEIAQTLVTIGVDLSRLHTVVDLQAGIEVADSLVGYRLVKVDPQPLAHAGTDDDVGVPEMTVPVLKQGDLLLASIQSALSDKDLLSLRDELVDKVGRFRSTGVIIDVTTLDVMDSFATRNLRSIAHMTKLRGAETVIVGIQPDVAFSMVQLGLTLEGVRTALDLEEGLDALHHRPGG